MKRNLSTWVKRIAAGVGIACVCFASQAIPSYATENGIQPRVRSEEVLDTYKGFHNGLFYKDKYDMTYRLLTFPNSYSLDRVDTISVTDGYYSGYYGYVTTYKCIYNVW